MLIPHQTSQGTQDEGHRREAGGGESGAGWGVGFLMGSKWIQQKNNRVAGGIQIFFVVNVSYST